MSVRKRFDGVASFAEVFGRHASKKQWLLFDKRQKDSDRAKAHSELLKDLKRLQSNMTFKKNRSRKH